MRDKINFGVKLRHFASYLPSNKINNDEIMCQMKSSLSGDLLYRTVGSVEKRCAKKSEMGSDMLAKVGNELLRTSNIDSKSIDKLICSCDPADQAAPDSAVLVQMKMGLECVSFGVSMSCVGWLCGINIAKEFIKNGDKRILVLSASTVGSKYFFVNPMHRAIFGDGAGGVLLERMESPGNILAIELMTLGKYYKEIFAPNPWTEVPKEIPDIYNRAFYMSPDNKVFFDSIDRYVKPFYSRQYAKANLSSNDISLFIVHQASMPLFNYTIKALGVPNDKVANYFNIYGNTISAELPILLDHEIKAGRAKKNDYVYLLTYGAGFTVGAMIIKI